MHRNEFERNYAFHWKDELLELNWLTNEPEETKTNT